MWEDTLRLCKYLTHQTLPLDLASFDDFCLNQCFLWWLQNGNFLTLSPCPHLPVGIQNSFSLSSAICLSVFLPTYLSSAWTWGFLFYLLGNNPLLSVLMLKSDWADGSPFKLAPYPVFSSFLFSILLFGTTSFFRFIWCLPCPSLRICHFSKDF